LVGDDPVRARALTLMQALIAQDRDWHFDKNATNAETLTHLTETTYALLDLIIARAVPDGEKVELLALLASAACPGMHIYGLCRKVMLCYPQAAFVLLRARLEALEEINLQQPAPEMGSLVRFGTPGCRQILEWLDDERDERRRLGLAGLVVLGKGLNPRWWVKEGSIEQKRGDARFHDYWDLLSQDLDPTVLDTLLERAVALTSSADAEAREAAMSALGGMRRYDEPVVAALRRCLDHDERPTRLAALKALGEIGLVERGGQIRQLTSVEARIMALTEVDHRAEQVAALTALGRLRFESARALLIARAEAAENAEVREAAVNGLGQIGGEESAVLLRRLQVSGSKDLRKKASRWLQRLAEDEPAAPSPAQLARQKRLARFGGDQAEDTPFHGRRFHSNLGAAVRSLPEIRAYPELELTRFIAQVCVDYSYARRILADRGILHREGGVCTLTEAGQRVWRVEHFIQDHYLPGAPV
jgi:hypothetical protein